MKLTTSLIEDYVSKASDILYENVKEFNPVTVDKIVISSMRSSWVNITKLDNNHYQIKVSKIFEEIPSKEPFEERLTSCMIHELIHTIKGCHGHKDNFQRIANIVTKKTSYKITTGVSAEKYGVTNTPRGNKYVITCNKCDKHFYYKRRPKMWNNFNNCTCPYCKGSNFSQLELN